MSSEGHVAREHLAELDQAMQVSSVASFAPGSCQDWLLVACLGPALIWGFTVGTGIADERVQWLLVAGAALFGCLGAAGLVKNVVDQRRLYGKVRGKSPRRGGLKPPKWLFAGNLAMFIPTNIAINMVWLDGVNRPFLLGGLLFVWLAFVPGYFYRRHAETLGQVRAI